MLLKKIPHLKTINDFLKNLDQSKSDFEKIKKELEEHKESLRQRDILLLSLNKEVEFLKNENKTIYADILTLTQAFNSMYFLIQQIDNIDLDLDDVKKKINYH